jgi:hypothetical protein
MKDLILFCIIAAVCVSGYFLMKKLDLFLDNNCRRLSESHEASALRIAFEIPAWAGSVSELLDGFSKENPDCKLYLFFGSAEEIKRKLAENELDFGFITAFSDGIVDDKYACVSIPISQNTMTAGTAGLPVISLGSREMITSAIWKDDNSSFYGKVFAAQLSRYSPAGQLDKVENSVQL